MRLTFVKKQHEIGDIWSFYFQPDKVPPWQAGQYLNLTMPDVAPVYADRIFSIASAPHEELLQFTTILSPSPFKQKLDSLTVGTEIEADQLGGDFTYEAAPVIPTEMEGSGHHPLGRSLDKLEMTRRLFIAGGIGITPYISIIRDKIFKKEPINATLLYAGKTEKCPFINELAQASKTDPSLNIKRYSDSKLTMEQLKKDIPKINEFVVYLAGSQKFSEAIGEGLIADGFPRNQIKYDYFDGYIDIEY